MLDILHFEQVVLFAAQLSFIQKHCWSFFATAFLTRRNDRDFLTAGVTNYLGDKRLMPTQHSHSLKTGAYLPSADCPRYKWFDEKLVPGPETGTGRTGSSPHCSVLGEAITETARAKKSCLFAQVFVLSGILFCSQRWLIQLAHHQTIVVFIL